MELPKRKSIRLKDYDYSQNGAYFVTICTHNKECILGEIVGDDAHIIPKTNLSKIGLVVQKYINGITGLQKYIIMPNHIHLIITIGLSKDGAMWASNGAMWASNGAMWASHPTRQSIPQLVKSFKIMVTKQIGFSVWQRSYHDHIIRNEQEYQKIWEYIDTNPLKWQEDCYHAK